MSVFYKLTDLSPEVYEFLLYMAAKGILIFAIAGCINWLLRNASAAVRHIVWVLAFCAVSLLPLLILTVPGVGIPILPAEDITAAEITHLPNAPLASDLPAGMADNFTQLPDMSGYNNDFVYEDDTLASTELAPSPEIAESIAPRPAFSTAQYILLAWVVGIVICLCPVFYRLLLLAVFQLKCQPVKDENLGSHITNICQQLKITSRIKVITNDDNSGRLAPMVWGLHPAVLFLPKGNNTWDNDQTNSVLLHELAHIKRHDWISQLFCSVVCAIYWFNPFTWYALSRLRIEREQACDDLVINSGIDHADYAEHLVGIARKLVRRQPVNSAALAMARNTQIESRIKAILDIRKNRRAVTRVMLAGFTIAVAAVSIPLAALQLEERKAEANNAEIEKEFDKELTWEMYLGEKKFVNLKYWKDAIDLDSDKVVSIEEGGEYEEGLELICVTNMKNGARSENYVSFILCDKNGKITKESKHRILLLKAENLFEAKEEVEKRLGELYKSTAIMNGFYIDKKITCFAVLTDGLAYKENTERLPKLVLAKITKAGDKEVELEYRVSKRVFDGLMFDNKLLLRRHAEAVDDKVKTLYVNCSVVRNDGRYVFPEEGITLKELLFSTYYKQETMDEAYINVMRMIENSEGEKAFKLYGRRLDNLINDRESDIALEPSDLISGSYYRKHPSDKTFWSKYEWSDVVELTIDGNNVGNIFVDLDNGKLFFPPTDFSPSDEGSLEKFKKWVKTNSIDVMGETSNSVRGLFGLNLESAVQVDDFLWDIDKSETLHRRIKTDEWKILSFENESLTTYLIETSEYKAGVLQILDINDNTRQIKIRYKLLEKEKIKRSDPLNLSGMVVTADKGALSGAQVAIIDSQQAVMMKDGGKLYEGYGSNKCKIVETDSEGKFDLGEWPKEEFTLVASNDSGWAIVKGNEFVKSQKLALKPWGSIKGNIANKNNAIAANVWLSGFPNSTWMEHKINFSYQTTSDTQGEFEFANLPEGMYEVGYLTRMGEQGGWSTTSRTPVDVVSGAESNMTIGGEGRPVKGRFVTPEGYKGKVYFGNGVRSLSMDGPEYPYPDNYKQMTQREQNEWHINWKASEDYKEWYNSFCNLNWRAYGFNINKNGTFTIDDVKPGEYSFYVVLEEGYSSNSPYPNELGGYYGKLIVPEAPYDLGDTFDCGELELDMYNVYHIGDPAPQFEVTTIDGQKYKLSDLRGKVVLLDFWYTINPRNMDKVQAAYDKYKDDDRLVILGFCMNKHRREMDDYLAENPSDWPQVFYDKLTILHDYGEHHPGMILIGPNGEILSRWLELSSASKLQPLLDDTMAKMKTEERRLKRGTAPLNIFFDKATNGSSYLENIQIIYTENTFINDKLSSSVNNGWLQSGGKFNFLSSYNENDSRRVVYDGDKTTVFDEFDEEQNGEDTVSSTASIVKGMSLPMVTPLRAFLKKSNYVLHEEDVTMDDLFENMINSDYMVKENGGYTITNAEEYVKQHVYLAESGNDNIALYLANGVGVSKVWLSPKNNWLIEKIEFYNMNRSLQSRFEVKEIKTVDGKVFPARIIETHFYNGVETKTVETIVNDIDISPEAASMDFEIDLPVGTLVVDKDTDKSFIVQTKVSDPIKPFTIYGRVVDVNGNAMAGVEIRANCGIGTLWSTGSTVSDAEGNYKLNFGPGMRSLVNDKWSISLQAATIHAGKTGYFDQNLCQQGNLGIAGDADQASNGLWGKNAFTKILLPDEPYKVDFIMAKGAAIEAVVIDANGDPLKEFKLSLKGEKQYPSTSVMASITTDDNGKFKLDSIPNKGYFFEHDGKKSEEIKFESGQLHNLDIVYDGKSLKVKTTGNDHLNTLSTISGKVVDESGNGISGAFINVNYRDEDMTSYNFGMVTTDEAGKFNLLSLPEDESGYVAAEIFVTVPGMVKTQVDILNLTSEQRSNFVVVIKKGLDLAGTLFDSLGNLAANVLIELMPNPDEKGTTNYTHRRAVTTDSNGKFKWEGITPRSYNVFAVDVANLQKVIIDEIKIEPDYVQNEDLQIKMKSIEMPDTVKPYEILGMTVVDIDDDVRKAFELASHDYGLLILNPGENPDRFGIGELKAGDFFRNVGDNAQLNCGYDFVSQLLAEISTDSEITDKEPRVVYNLRREFGVAVRTQYMKLSQAEISELKKLKNELPQLPEEKFWSEHLRFNKELNISKAMLSAYKGARFEYFREHNSAPRTIDDLQLYIEDEQKRWQYAPDDSYSKLYQGYNFYQWLQENAYLDFSITKNWRDDNDKSLLGYSKILLEKYGKTAVIVNDASLSCETMTKEQLEYKIHEAKFKAPYRYKNKDGQFYDFYVYMDRFEKESADSFYSVYKLDEGENLKRIEPPYIPERLDYYFAESTSQAEAIPEGPDVYSFIWDDDKPARKGINQNKLQRWGCSFGPSEGHSVSGVIDFTLKIPNQRFEIESGIGSLKLPGDWIIRKRISEADKLEALKVLLKEEKDKTIEYELRKVVRETLVVKGEYIFTPLDLDWAENSICLTSDSNGPHHHREGGGGGYAVTVGELINNIGEHCGIPVVDEVQNSDMEINMSFYHDHTSYLNREKDKQQKAEKLEILLDYLRKQTNLDFSLEQRQVEIWFIKEVIDNQQEAI